MARIELKGTFLAVMPVVEVGEKKTLKQTIIFETKNVDEYGDQKGDSEQWEFTVLGDKIAEIGIAANAIGRKAKVNVFVNSKKFTMTDGRIIYPISLILNKVEFAEPKPAV
jgi:hypothetical protein